MHREQGYSKESAQDAYAREDDLAMWSENKWDCAMPRQMLYDSLSKLVKSYTELMEVDIKKLVEEKLKAKEVVTVVTLAEMAREFERGIVVTEKLTDVGVTETRYWRSMCSSMPQRTTKNYRASLELKLRIEDNKPIVTAGDIVYLHAEMPTYDPRHVENVQFLERAFERNLSGL